MYKNKGYAWNILRLIGEGVAMTKDLTVGSPMKLIWQFSIPLVLGNLFQQMYNMVDTVIVGRYLGAGCPDQCKFYHIYYISDHWFLSWYLYRAGGSGGTEIWSKKLQ